MLVASCKLVGKAPIAFGKHVTEQKKPGEASDAYERRTWKEKCHTDGDGSVYIPPTALKNCLAECAKYLQESVPGKGKSTYTRFFEAGVMVTEPLMLVNGGGKSIHVDDMEAYPMFVPADGRRGSGKRVERIFPIARKWIADAIINIFDPTLVDKPEKIQEYLVQAGQFIGLGSFRPRNNGYFGRFAVENYATKKM